MSLNLNYFFSIFEILSSPEYNKKTKTSYIVYILLVLKYRKVNYLFFFRICYMKLILCITCIFFLFLKNNFQDNTTTKYVKWSLKLCVSAHMENNSLNFLCLNINFLLSLKHTFLTQYNTLITMPEFVYIIANLCFLNDILLQI